MMKNRIKKWRGRMRRWSAGALAGICLLSSACLAGPAYAADAAGTGAIDWPGAHNHPYGNAVVDYRLATNTDEIYQKWSVFVGSPSDLTGYFAGQTVIANGYLYITGQGKLYQIDLETGKTVNQTEGGSTSIYYDYLAYGEGKVFVACPNYIQAFDADSLALLWRTTTGGQHSYLVGGQVNTQGDYGLYRPLVYHEGYLFCGRNAFRTSGFETDSKGYNRPVWTIDDEFNRNSGAAVGDMYYVASAQTLYAVNYRTGEVADRWKFSSSRTQATWSGVAYSEETGRLYWGSYVGSCAYSIRVNKDGTLDPDSAVTQKSAQRTAGTPVVYNGRVYIAGENGSIDVLDAESLSRIYTNRNSSSGKVQSTPILTTAYEDDDPEKPGHVYLYYQGYNSPGTTFVMEDWQGNTQAQAIQKAAVPSRAGSSTEQLAADADGNLYSYNESGYLFGFKSSAVWLEELEVEEAMDPLDFDPKRIDYECMVKEAPGGIHLNFRPSKGGGVRVDGKLYSGTSMALAADATEVTLEVFNQEDPEDTRTRVYHVEISHPSADASLADLALSKNGTAPMGISPSFSPDTDFYDASYTKDTTKVRLSITLSEAHASVSVAGSGLTEDAYQPAAGKNGVYTCDVAMAKGADTALVYITVTAQDRSTRKVYTVRLTRPDEDAPVLSRGSAKRRSDTSAEVTFTTTEDGLLYARTAKAGAGTARPDTSGAGIPVKKGQNTVTIDGMSARDTFIYLVEQDAAGNASNVLQVVADVYPTREPTVTNAAGTATKTIRVTWQAVSGAEGYNIYRKTSGGSYSLAGTAGNGSTVSYTDTSVAIGTKYTYTVQAWRTVDGSRYYSEYGKSYRTGVTWYPGKAQLKSATASGYSSVTLRWTRQSKVTGYYVYRSTGGSFSRIATVNGADKNSYKDQKAPCGTTCRYMVRAYVKNGSAVYTGYYSDKKSAKPKLSKPSLTVRVAGYRAKLSWGKVSGATGYEIYMKQGKTSYKKIKNVKTVTLKRNKDYRFKVRAYRKVKGKKVYSPFSVVRKVKI